MKDWTGNKFSTMNTIGASNFAKHERVEHDYYATEPKAAELLLELEDFDNVWECASGESHLADVFAEHGILGRKSDIVDRTGDTEVFDFLNVSQEKWGGCIVTNPPYKFAKEFITNALEMVEEGKKVAMFLPIRYLEGKERKKLFTKNPPKVVYVSSSRLKCAMNGDFDNMTCSVVCYCWFVWVKGYKGETVLKWFN